MASKTIIKPGLYVGYLTTSHEITILLLLINVNYFYKILANKPKIIYTQLIDINNGELMLGEIEALLLPALKNILLNPNIVATELESVYKIFKDIKVLTHGQAKSEDKKQA